MEEKSEDKYSVADMSVKISANTDEFNEKMEEAKRKADALLESLSKIPDVEVEVKSDLNGDKSS